MLKNYINRLVLLKDFKAFSVWLDLVSGNRVYSENGYIIGEEVRTEWVSEGGKI